MPKILKYVTSFAIVLTVCFWWQAAAALDESVTSTARALAQEGEQDFKEGRFAEASEKFLNAYQAVRVPTLARSAARALIQQGKLVRASELYRQALVLQSNELWIGNVQQDAQNKARDELAALMPRLGRLKVQVQGVPSADVQVSIDDVRVPNSLLGVNQYVDPGERHLVANSGTRLIEQTVAMGEGEQREVLLDLGSDSGRSPQRAEPESVKATEAPSGHARTYGWVALGVGAAGLAVGATAGILVAIKHSDSAQDCPDNTCDPGKVSTGFTDGYNTLRAVSVIGFAAGAVGAALGVTLLLTAPANDKPNVSAWFSPHGAGIRGAF